MNEEFNVTPGTREELIARWQHKYGYSKEKAKTRAWPVFLARAGARVRNNGKNGKSHTAKTPLLREDYDVGPVRELL